MTLTDRDPPLIVPYAHFFQKTFVEFCWSRFGLNLYRNIAIKQTIKLEPAGTDLGGVSNFFLKDFGGLIAEIGQERSCHSTSEKY